MKPTEITSAKINCIKVWPHRFTEGIVYPVFTLSGYRGWDDGTWIAATNDMGNIEQVLGIAHDTGILVLEMWFAEHFDTIPNMSIEQLAKLAVKVANGETIESDHISDYDRAMSIL